MLRRSILASVLALAGTVGFLAGGGSESAWAKDKPGKAAAKKKAEEEKPTVDLDAYRKRLSGTEEDAIATLQEIAEKGPKEAAPVVGELLERGANPKILEEALKTAGKLKAESLSPAVAPYVQHRSEEIRRGAVRALLKTKGPVAVKALREALKSGDAVVRGTAATGLGALGAHDALPDLFRAFDHGIAEAGAGIGQLCTPAECEDFADRTGKVAFDVMITGFDQILFRAPSDIPDEEKIKLVGRMREIGTAEVGKYLADVGERWPKDWSKKVKQAIDSAARAVGGGVKK